MKKYQIENVQVGIEGGGVPCGPGSGVVVAEVCVRALDDGTVSYHILEEVEGLEFAVSEKSCYENLYEEVDFEDPFWQEFEKCRLDSYGSYSEFYEALENHTLCKEEYEPIWKYLAYIVSADWDKTNEMKEMSIGKVLGEFELPVCEMEQEYLDQKNSRE